MSTDFWIHYSQRPDGSERQLLTRAGYPARKGTEIATWTEAEFGFAFKRLCGRIGHPYTRSSHPTTYRFSMPAMFRDGQPYELVFERVEVPCVKG